MSSVIDILNQIGYTQLIINGNGYRARPIYRDSGNPNSLLIDKDSGRWYDFGLSEGGTLNKLVEKTLNITAEQAALITSTAELKINTPEYNDYELKTTKIFDKNLIKNLVCDFNYWVSRGINEEILNLFGGGMALKGKLINRYVFPIWNEQDNLIGFAGRLVNDVDFLPKWKILGSKSNFIYPFNQSLESISNEKSVILVESIGDMLNLYQNRIKNVLVCFGISISPQIILHLLKYSVKNIYIAFNNDIDNGLIGNNAAYKEFNKLLGFFDKNQLHVSLPIKKDFGVMNREEILLWKQNLKKN